MIRKLLLFVTLFLLFNHISAQEKRQFYIEIEEGYELGVPDIKDLKISLAPNPVRDLLVLHLDDGFSPMRMEIIDLQGRMMQQLDIHNPETQIDVSRYSAGVYLIKLTDQSGKQQTSRFVKL